VAESGRPSWWQLALECAQRELTYLPIAASCMLVWALPAWPPTWVIAPVLFTAGGAHFIYDLVMGQEVRASLAARQERKAEGARDAALAELAARLSPEDQGVLSAVRALEKSLLDKFREHQRTLELTGTFVHTYADMARSVAASAADMLRKKSELARTARELEKLDAAEEARALAEKLPLLDARVAQARETLQEALAKVTLMETEQDQAAVSGLSESLKDRLELASQIARDVQEAMRTAAPGAQAPGSEGEHGGEAAAPGERAGAFDAELDGARPDERRRRDRQRTRE
jgi:hypothetical protein